MTLSIALLSCALCFISGAVICLTPTINDYVQYKKQHADVVSKSELFANQVIGHALGD